ncbi:family 43 glycosylhydrolase [Stakelama marina]|uniref:Family 43 glycosylhydrolase n=1 Tax=Stakelama marina TaxID=2826939 RepID=A0A8T4IDJ2_9SPHN|nr:family 43 glycosylhydrolase [Stakelama marina]MBR0551924.1 family 43 glycosylhydrolase [Stakelama marina]
MSRNKIVAVTRACALAIATASLASCGGAGGSGSVSSPAPSPTPPPTGGTQTPDAGTVATVDDSVAIRIQNADTGQYLTIDGDSQTAGAAIAQAGGTSSSATGWHAIPMPNRQYNIENMLSHQVMGISAAAKTAGAAAVQWADNGTSDHLWTFYKLQNGNYLIKNANSGLYLQADTDSSGKAVIDQGERATSGTGCACQEWSLVQGTDPVYSMPPALTGSGIDVHDPDLIQDTSGKIWLYGTHNTLATSTDGQHFTSTGSPIISPDFPWWASKNTTWQGRTDIWAPSILHANGIYYLYYSIPIYQTPSDPTTNQGAQALIALATSTSPNGPWADAGKIIESCGDAAGCTTTFNAIDPAPFIDANGRWWMSFGSWQDGIHVLELDPATGLRLHPDATPVSIAARGAGEEGSFILPRVVNGKQWYYYFASINPCCSADSTYRVVMGRSENPTGPYLDRGGLDLRDGGGTILVSTHDYVVGPGGESVRDVNGKLKLVYHFYDARANGAPKLGLNDLAFDGDGWPYLK